MELVSVESKAIGSLATSPTSPQQRSLQSSGSCSSEASEAAAVARRRSAASDQEEVLLRLLLVSGNRSDFPCPLDWSVFQLKQNVIKNWPKEWQCEEKTDRVERLRILYQGRFLEDGICLKSTKELPVDPC